MRKKGYKQRMHSRVVRGKKGVRKKIMINPGNIKSKKVSKKAKVPTKKKKAVKKIQETGFYGLVSPEDFDSKLKNYMFENHKIDLSKKGFDLSKDYEEVVSVLDKEIGKVKTEVKYLENKLINTPSSIPPYISVPNEKYSGLLDQEKEVTKKLNELRNKQAPLLREVERDKSKLKDPAFNKKLRAINLEVENASFSLGVIKSSLLKTSKYVLASNPERLHDSLPKRNEKHFELKKKLDKKENKLRFLNNLKLSVFAKLNDVLVSKKFGDSKPSIVEKYNKDNVLSKDWISKVFTKIHNLSKGSVGKILRKKPVDIVKVKIHSDPDRVLGNSVGQICDAVIFENGSVGFIKDGKVRIKPNPLTSKYSRSVPGNKLEFGFINFDPERLKGKVDIPFFESKKEDVSDVVEEEVHGGQISNSVRNNSDWMFAKHLLASDFENLRNYGFELVKGSNQVDVVEEGEAGKKLVEGVVKKKMRRNLVRKRVRRRKK